MTKEVACCCRVRWGREEPNPPDRPGLSSSSNIRRLPSALCVPRRQPALLARKPLSSANRGTIGCVDRLVGLIGCANGVEPDKPCPPAPVGTRAASPRAPGGLGAPRPPVDMRTMRLGLRSTAHPTSAKTPRRAPAHPAHRPPVRSGSRRAARAGAGLSADRRPEQRPAPRSCRPRSGSSGASRGRATSGPANRSRPRRCLLHPGYRGIVDERGVQPADRRDLAARPDHRGPTAAPASPAPRRTSSRTRTTRTSSANGDVWSPTSATAACCDSAEADESSARSAPPAAARTTRRARCSRRTARRRCRRRRARHRDRRLRRPDRPRSASVWSIRTPTSYPSDAQLLPDGNMLVAGFNTPGRIDELTPDGKIVWTYGPASGPGALDRPSLAVRWPNGMIAATDDWHHRIVVIDPRTKRIVWQYGHLGVASAAPRLPVEARRARPAPRSPPRRPRPCSVAAPLAATVRAPDRSLPEPASRMAAVALPGGRILALGGLVAWTSSDQVLLGRRSHVRIVGRLPTPTHDAAAAPFGAGIGLFGGGESVSTDAVIRVDPTTGAARAAGRLDEPLSDLEAVRLGARTYLDRRLRLSFRLGSAPVGPGTATTTAARLPVGLRYAGVTALGGTIYVAGGRSARRAGARSTPSIRARGGAGDRAPPRAGSACAARPDRLGALPNRRPKPGGSRARADPSHRPADRRSLPSRRAGGTHRGRSGLPVAWRSDRARRIRGRDHRAQPSRRRPLTARTRAQCIGDPDATSVAGVGRPRERGSHVQGLGTKPSFSYNCRAAVFVETTSSLHLNDADLPATLTAWQPDETKGAIGPESRTVFDPVHAPDSRCKKSCLEGGPCRDRPATLGSESPALPAELTARPGECSRATLA